MIKFEFMSNMHNTNQSIDDDENKDYKDVDENINCQTVQADDQQYADNNVIILGDGHEQE